MKTITMPIEEYEELVKYKDNFDSLIKNSEVYVREGYRNLYFNTRKSYFVKREDEASYLSDLVNKLQKENKLLKETKKKWWI